jgi:hypothetical protein
MCFQDLCLELSERINLGLFAIAASFRIARNLKKIAPIVPWLLRQDSPLEYEGKSYTPGELFFPTTGRAGC